MVALAHAHTHVHMAVRAMIEETLIMDVEGELQQEHAVGTITDTLDLIHDLLDAPPFAASPAPPPPPPPPPPPAAAPTAASVTKSKAAKRRKKRAAARAAASAKDEEQEEATPPPPAPAPAPVFRPPPPPMAPYVPTYTRAVARAKQVQCHVPRVDAVCTPPLGWCVPSELQTCILETGEGPLDGLHAESVCVAAALAAHVYEGEDGVAGSDLEDMEDAIRSGVAGVDVSVGMLQRALDVWMKARSTTSVCLHTHTHTAVLSTHACVLAHARARVRVWNDPHVDVCDAVLASVRAGAAGRSHSRALALLRQMCPPAHVCDTPAACTSVDVPLYAWGSTQVPAMAATHIRVCTCVMAPLAASITASLSHAPPIRAEDITSILDDALDVRASAVALTHALTRVHTRACLRVDIPLLRTCIDTAADGMNELHVTDAFTWLCIALRHVCGSRDTYPHGMALAHEYATMSRDFAHVVSLAPPEDYAAHHNAAVTRVARAIVSACVRLTRNTLYVHSRMHVAGRAPLPDMRARAAEEAKDIIARALAQVCDTSEGVPYVWELPEVVPPGLPSSATPAALQAVGVCVHDDASSSGEVRVREFTRAMTRMSVRAHERKFV